MTVVLSSLATHYLLTTYALPCCCCRFVTQQELAVMMQPDSGLRWSPWFKIIAESFLPKWWSELPDALASDRFADRATIHHILV